MKGELFDGKQVKDRQTGLNVPGRENFKTRRETCITPAVQKKLKANFQK